MKVIKTFSTILFLGMFWLAQPLQAAGTHPTATLEFHTIGPGTYSLTGTLDTFGYIDFGFELPPANPGDPTSDLGNGLYYVKLWLTADDGNTSIQDITAWSDWGVFYNSSNNIIRQWDSQTETRLAFTGGMLWPDYYLGSLSGSANQTVTLNIDVQLAAVPEPSTWLLMIGGLSGLLLLRRRRRR